MSTLLLIGGTGFFGKSFLDSFQRGQLKEWEVDRVIAMARNADRLRLEAPELLDDRVELLNTDITTTDWLPAADYVIHAAASTDARNYINQPDIERQNIEAAAHNYCRLAQTYHSNSKIVYISSGAVYGTQPPDLEFIDENFVFKAPSDIPEEKRAYAIAKRDAEAAFKQIAAAGLKVAVARCFAFVGRWLPRDQHFAIGNFIEDGLRNRPIRINARCAVYRSYMFADDLVFWLMRIAKSANQQAETYNVGSDEVVRLEELSSLLSKRFGVSVIFTNHIDPSRIDRYIPCIEKSKSLLGLKLNYGLEESLKKTINMI